MGCVLTFCKRTQASLDLFADALELTEEAVQSGHKIDSLEVTIALEIFSHFPPGLGGFKYGKTQILHYTHESGTRSDFLYRKYFFHRWRWVSQVSPAANVG